RFAPAAGRADTGDHRRSRGMPSAPQGRRVVRRPVAVGLPGAWTMGDRKRRSLALSVEPMERRDVLSASVLVALQPTNVPYLTPAQVAATAAKQAHSTGQVAASGGV